MKHYPKFVANSTALAENAKRIIELCKPFDVQITAVAKGFNCIPDCCDVLFKSGCLSIASSRIKHLEALKKNNPEIETMLIRVPMYSELSSVIRHADSVLVSEVETLKKLNEVARSENRIAKIILMRDVGDLREGFFYADHLLKAAFHVEHELENLKLYGVGTNLSCYGSVLPTFENLSELSNNALEIEKMIGRELEIVSGGATTSLPALLRGEVPEKINHLRLGECMYCPPTAWDHDIEGMRRDVFQIQAQIIELNIKPTYPIGKRGKAAFGKIKEYVDRGFRKRAIVALGNQDTGDATNVLLPVDGQMSILGASGDHVILDIEDCNKQYKLGDIITFNLLYQGCVYSSMSPTVYKETITE